MANPKVMAEFLANNGEKPQRPRNPSGTLKRSPIKRGKAPGSTVKQKILDARWAGIREASIYWLNRLDPDGAHCFECGRKSRTLDLDHVVPRSAGGHYSVSNSALLCRECHNRKHRNQPEWSKESAS